MKLSVVFLPLLFSHFLNAQELLVNGGVEDINTCTEYKIECAAEAWISSSNSFINFFKDPRRAHSGQNCIAVEAGNFKAVYSRTFIRSRLLCGLRKGNQYLLSFYIKSPFDIMDSVGILFSSTDPLLGRGRLDRITPSFFLKGMVAPHKKNMDSAWREVKITYTATGEERYIMFGYFAKNDFVEEQVHPLENRYFVFFDDISMRPADPVEGICQDWQAMKEDIYDENERHDFLQRKLKHYRSNPPPPLKVSTTTYVIIDTLVLPDLLFQTGKAILEPSSYALLDSFAAKINAYVTDSVVIEGHTDSTGTPELNHKLSIARAAAVKDYLFSKTGYANMVLRGESYFKPVADNREAEGRQKNRRVAVFLYIRN
jgi:outer membrane protein OmpA-like peptidoglycan-associated protein